MSPEIKLVSIKDGWHRITFGLNMIKTKKTGLPCGLLFLDAEKAFDHLERRYLSNVLGNFKFCPNLIKMIQRLYGNPSSRVVTGGHFPNLFNIL